MSSKRNRVSPYRSPLGQEAERRPIAVRVEEERASEGRLVTERILVASRLGLHHRMRKQADFSLVLAHEKA